MNYVLYTEHRYIKRYDLQTCSADYSQEISWLFSHKMEDCRLILFMIVIFGVLRTSQHYKGHVEPVS